MPHQSSIRNEVPIRSGFTFGPAEETIYSSAIDRVYFIDEGTNGLAVIQFGDGLIGARPPVGGNHLIAKLQFGLGASGNVPSDSKFSLRVSKN